MLCAFAYAAAAVGRIPLILFLKYDPKDSIIAMGGFACTAAFIYRKKPKLSGAVIGLLCGWGCMVLVMLLWNYLMAPIYMGYPQEAVAALLMPAFLPFNLI